MSLSSAAIGAITGSVKEAFSGLNNLFTSDDERLTKENELISTIIAGVDRAQGHITARHETDMKSDSWLSKNVRPLVLIYLLIATTIFAAVDSGLTSFTVATHWVDLFTGLLQTVFGFYFVARGAEKVMKMYTDSKSKES